MNSNKNIVYFVVKYLSKIYDFVFFKKNKFSYKNFIIYILILFIINLFSIIDLTNSKRKRAVLSALIEDIEIDSTKFKEEYKSLYYPIEYENYWEDLDYKNTCEQDFTVSKAYPYTIHDSLLVPDSLQVYEYENIKTGKIYTENDFVEYQKKEYINWKKGILESALNENLKLKKYFKDYGIDKTYEKYGFSELNDNVATLNLNYTIERYTRIDSELILIVSFLLGSLLGSIIIEYILIHLSRIILRKNSLFFLLLYLSSLIFIKSILPLLIFNSKYSDFGFNNLIENLSYYHPISSFSIEPSYSSALSFLFPINNLLIYLNFLDSKHLYILIPLFSIHLIFILCALFTILISRITSKSFINKIIIYVFSFKEKQVELKIAILGIILILHEIFITIIN